MKVSVIIPVYNVEKYLENCLDSIVNQTYKNIEIIIVNDGSPDNSKLIIDKFQKKYPKIIKGIEQKNAGVSEARNAGIDKSSGDYIMFVDGDDWISNNTIELAINELKKDNSDMVSFNMTNNYPNGRIEKFNNVKQTHKFMNIGSTCNKIYKKELFKKIKFLPNIWYEDLNIIVKILLNTNNISLLDKHLYHCNVREGSTMHNNNSIKNLDIIIAFEDLKKYMIENNLWENNQKLYESLVYEHVLFVSILRVQEQKNKDKKEVLKKLLQFSKKEINYNMKDLEFYQLASRNQKIISVLNYYNLAWLSTILLRFKEWMKKK